MPMHAYCGFWQYLLVTSLALITLCPCSIAEIWTDDFNDGDLEGWTHSAEAIEDELRRSSWEVRDGVLHATMDGLVLGEPWPFNRMDFLQLTAFPLSASALTVEITVVEFDDIGIALGVPSEHPQETGRFRIFRPYDSNTVAMLTNGGFNLLGEDGTGDQVIFEDVLGQHLRVAFEAGVFHAYSQGTLVADIIDEDYPRIELVGLFAWALNVKGHPPMEPPGLHGALDDFVISVPDIPNLAVAVQGKLASIWGGIKHGVTR